MAGGRKNRQKRHRSAQNDSSSRSVEELTRRNVERVSALEAAEHRKATTVDRIADVITNVSGSMTFVWLNVLSIAGWMVVNLALPQARRFDPFPFSLLTLVLSVEAIFLAIFILISQNRAARISEKRSHLDLQLNVLSEQENTKILLILEQIAHAVGAEIGGIPDVKVLEQATKPEALSDQIDQATEVGGQGEGGKSDPPAGSSAAAKGRMNRD